MARLRFGVAAAPLLLLCSCAIPVAEAPVAESVPTSEAAAPAEIVRQYRQPLHTSAFTQALEGWAALEPEMLAAFDARLDRDPYDWEARIKILAFATRADQIGDQENLARRRQQVFWLIEHAPGSEILRSHLPRFQPGELSPAEWDRAKMLWAYAASADPDDPSILANAAAFFLDVDPELRRHYLERAAEAEPDNARHGAALGEIYALEVIRSSREPSVEALELAADAERKLATTTNAAIAETASFVLHSELQHPFRRGRPAPELIAKLASHMAERARALNPDADESWVQPAPPPPLDRPRFHDPPTEAELADARSRVVRLRPSEFPELPTGIAGFLRDRQCGIPQISPSKEKSNVIRGELFQAGEAAWAVICSTGGRSQILVFRNDRDQDPHVLKEFADPICLAEEWNCGSYQIALTTVDREFILYHYRALGGPKPPPIDHHGIDVAFVEKASTIHYFYQGAWLQLRGGD